MLSAITGAASVDVSRANTPVSDDPNTPHLWTFKQFWWITAALTATTLFLPLVAGPAFRSVAQFSKEQRGLWRLVVFVVALLAAVTLALVGGSIGTLVLGIPYGLLACYRLYRVFAKDEGAKRWIFFTSLLTACLSSILR